MHILVSTAGILPPETVADFAEKLAGADRVTVMTVVQAPQEFLMEVADEQRLPYETPQTLEQASDVEADRYITELGNSRVGPMVAALEKRGIRTDTVFVEADDPADAIIRTAEARGAQAIVMGATLRLFTESAWKSVSMKVAAATNLPILLIPAPQPTPTDHP